MAEKSGLIVAIVGAESTGKSMLASELALRLGDATGLACAFVAEFLREWCDLAGRTPRSDEQEAIADEQRQRIEAATQTHDIVIADTTPLQTAAYSRFYFADHSLDGSAARWHRGRVAHTLVTALDFPWVADGLQRDGAHVREPVDTLLRELLAAHAIDWSRVAGSGEVRAAAALDAVAPLLRTLAAPQRGLFTRLEQRDAAQRDWPWLCDCDVPDCEHALRASAARPR
jgi:nicotinamide riboside kinase